jgi:hypothetical protein
VLVENETCLDVDIFLLVVVVVIYCKAETARFLLL